MANKITEKIVLGSLMRNPLLLSQVDKYSLSVDDFDTKLAKHIFFAVANIAEDGSDKIETQDIDVFLQNAPTSAAVFKDSFGIDYCNDAINIANEHSFGTYYELLKKENLLRDLKAQGFDTSEFYDQNPITKEGMKLNDTYLQMSIAEVLDIIKDKFFQLEADYLKEDTTETEDAAEGIEDLLDSYEEFPDIGMPLQGDIFNTVVSGARKGKLYIRSGRSGLGKTRNSVGDACYLAYPTRYDPITCRWEQRGYAEKVLFITTEQEKSEIQSMILAYLSGVNERKITKNKMTPEERKVVRQAAYVMKQYQGNFLVTRMPSPSVQVVKTTIRQHARRDGIEYVFYDYIFICPSLLGEFKGFQLRNDEILLIFTTALKDLAVELEIFIMSSTQVNASADNHKDIRNEGSIAGARAIINKADIGCIMDRPSKEEMATLQSVIDAVGVEPNGVIDMYKVRAGEMTQVRIWTHFDAGTLRMHDLFITDSRLQVVDFELENSLFLIDDEVTMKTLGELNKC